MKVILPASEIPIEAFVTKKGGCKRYILQDKIVIFGGEKKQEIKAEAGCRFLICEGANINMISGTTELTWEVEPDKLREYLDDILNLVEDK